MDREARSGLVWSGFWLAFVDGIPSFPVHEYGDVDARFTRVAVSFSALTLRCCISLAFLPLRYSCHA